MQSAEGRLLGPLGFEQETFARCNQVVAELLIHEIHNAAHARFARLRPKATTLGASSDRLTDTASPA